MLKTLALLLLVSLASAVQDVDLVFAMDTSGSMWTYAGAACQAISQVISALQAQGIAVHPRIWGISDTYINQAYGNCLSGDVYHNLGASAGTGECPIYANSYSESWATATAVVAERYPWTPGALRVVVPVSDECPCNGDGCYTDDTNAILNAINVANQNQVCAAPLIAGYSQTVKNYAQQLALGTGCDWFEVSASSNMAALLIQMVNRIIVVAPPVAYCVPQTVTVSAADCKGHGYNINGNPVDPALVYDQTPSGPLDIGTHTVTLNVSRPSDGQWATCQSTVTVVDTVPACTLCPNPLIIQPMNVSYTQTITTRVDKTYLYVTLTGPVVLHREYMGYAVAQEFLPSYVQGVCDYYSNGVVPAKATWSFWQQGCTDYWEGRFKLSDLAACGMTITKTATQQKINFKLYAYLKDHFPFGYTPADTPRPVHRVFDVEVIIDNFVSGSLNFVIHAPPTVLNAIIRERYDVIRQVYEIDVIKVVQSHFTITATGVTGVSAFPYTLIIDVLGDGSTDRLEITTPPPCSIPSSFTITYDVRCNGMVCRDNTWNTATVDFIIPADELCPTVSVTYSPTLAMILCSDAQCSSHTPNHILGYIMTLKATVTMVPPILKTEFYDVSFKDSVSLSKYAKQAFTVTPFGTFLGYTDTIGAADGVSYLNFVPKKGAAPNAFFATPDIHTPANFEINVVMYVEADLTQRIAGQFHVAKLLALEPTAESYARGTQGVRLADTEGAFADAPAEGTNVGLIVGLTVAAVAVVAGFLCFAYRRHAASLNKAETHIAMEQVVS
jgi:hypothetical protein